MSKYKENKAKAQCEAIEWQYDFDNHDYSYGELAWWLDYFYGKAKRFGLIKEFRNNGII